MVRASVFCYHQNMDSTKYNCEICGGNHPTEAHKFEFPTTDIKEYGVGHLDSVYVSEKDFDSEELPELLELYSASKEKIEALVESLSQLFEQMKIEENENAVFEDLKNGIQTALYRSINLFFYHGKINPKEAITAFDEMCMLLEIVKQSFVAPKIENKKTY